MSAGARRSQRQTPWTRRNKIGIQFCPGGFYGRGRRGAEAEVAINVSICFLNNNSGGGGVELPKGSGTQQRS